jgi:hypothetical protein
VPAGRPAARAAPRVREGGDDVEDAAGVVGTDEPAQLVPHLRRGEGLVVGVADRVGLLQGVRRAVVEPHGHPADPLGRQPPVEAGVVPDGDPGAERVGEHQLRPLAYRPGQRRPAQLGGEAAETVDGGDRLEKAAVCIPQAAFARGLPQRHGHLAPFRAGAPDEPAPAAGFGATRRSACRNSAGLR